MVIVLGDWRHRGCAVSRRRLRCGGGGSQRTGSRNASNLLYGRLPEMAENDIGIKILT